MTTRLRDMAAKINSYLKKFEADPAINRARQEGRNGLKPYYNAAACHSGRYVHVSYVSYQGGSNLTREQAERYLAWLEQGGIGKHHRAGEGLNGKV
jgi:hypothetical protein